MLWRWPPARLPGPLGPPAQPLISWPISNRRITAGPLCAYSTDVCHPVQRKVGSWPLFVMTCGGGTLRALALRSPLLQLDYNLGVLKQIGCVKSPDVRENTYDHVR